MLFCFGELLGIRTPDPLIKSLNVNDLSAVFQFRLASYIPLYLGGLQGLSSQNQASKKKTIFSKIRKSVRKVLEKVYCVNEKGHLNLRGVLCFY